ncbi:uncharacterized protein C7orf26 [Pieris brassicae]|uniref:Uncharacterized protein n=1 Tax=Pieris brassicae TaxID=7116 RepID=A0A9P0TQG8_PIEBR|nr:uncharacterized protein C7orf26 [Pieris brassicae]CAH4033019.1 unnamed protein product [Pieris brassicae]
MSASDLKHALRKFEYPACAKEALIKMEQLLIGRSAPSSKQQDIAMDITSEFIFCEVDRRGGRRGNGLNPLQELQLIDILSEYISDCNNETTKNTIFLSLFGSMESQRKLKILNILASMAVSASCTPVLLALGVWLQQMGCSSPQSLKLAQSVIQDHFYLNTSNQNCLKSLATTAPQFVSNFITAVTDLYMCDSQGASKMPPKNLLEVITSWVYSNPTLCMSAQLNPAALPVGAIPMAVVTPLAGLIQWCALASLYVQDTNTVEEEPPIKKIKIEWETHVKPITTNYIKESELYTKLHLAVLNSLRAGKRSHLPTASVNAQHLVSLTPMVQSYAHQLVKRGLKLQNDKKLQDCLDRLGQAVQVALANNCVYGNISNLLASLDTLPENKLLQIIIRKHQCV